MLYKLAAAPVPISEDINTMDKARFNHVHGKFITLSGYLAVAKTHVEHTDAGSMLVLMQSRPLDQWLYIRLRWSGRAYRHGCNAVVLAGWR